MQGSLLRAAVHDCSLLGCCSTNREVAGLSTAGCGEGGCLPPPNEAYPIVRPCLVQPALAARHLADQALWLLCSVTVRQGGNGGACSQGRTAKESGQQAGPGRNCCQEAVAHAGAPLKKERPRPRLYLGPTPELAPGSPCGSSTMPWAATAAVVAAVAAARRSGAPWACNPGCWAASAAASAAGSPCAAAAWAPWEGAWLPSCGGGCGFCGGCACPCCCPCCCASCSSCCSCCCCCSPGCCGSTTAAAEAGGEPCSRAAGGEGTWLPCAGRNMQIRHGAARRLEHGKLGKGERPDLSRDRAAKCRLQTLPPAHLCAMHCSSQQHWLFVLGRCRIALLLYCSPSCCWCRVCQGWKRTALCGGGSGGSWGSGYPCQRQLRRPRCPPVAHDCWRRGAGLGGPREAVRRPH